MNRWAVVLMFCCLLNACCAFAESNEEKGNQLRERAVKLQEEGKYSDAAKMYREAAKLLKGQESDDGEPLSPWVEGNAITCECLEQRPNAGEKNVDQLVAKLKPVLKAGKDKKASMSS